MTNVEDLERTLMDLALRVRQGDGLAPDSFPSCIDAIRVAATRWQSEDGISRREAALLIAFYPDVESASWSYPEAEQEEIVDVASQINNEILDAIAGAGPNSR